MGEVSGATLALIAAGVVSISVGGQPTLALAELAEAEDLPGRAASAFEPAVLNVFACWLNPRSRDVGGVT